MDLLRTGSDVEQKSILSGKMPLEQSVWFKLHARLHLEQYHCDSKPEIVPLPGATQISAIGETGGTVYFPLHVRQFDFWAEKHFDCTVDCIGKGPHL